MNRRIVIFTDDPGWHGKRLTAAFAARGCEASYVSLMQCRLESASAYGVVIPGYEDAPPDGAFVRGVPGGTLEQVVLRLDVLHALRELGVPVYNDGRAIERSVDKAMTTFLLGHAGLPTPPTWVSESEQAARAVLMRECGAGREVVVKPLFGSQGKGLRRLAAVADLPAADEYDGTWYLQRYIDNGEGNWHDFRVFVIGGRAVAAMVRRGTHWISNVAQGGRCEWQDHDSELGELAEAAARALGMDYAGIDIIRDGSGQAFVVEVNGIPAWRGLQRVTALDVAQCLVDDMLGRRLPRPAMEVAC